MWKKFFVASVTLAGIFTVCQGYNVSAITDNTATITGGEWDICVATDGQYSNSNFAATISATGFNSQIVFGDFEDESCETVKLADGDYTVQINLPMGVSGMTKTITGNKVSFDATIANRKYLSSFGMARRAMEASEVAISFDANGGTGDMLAMANFAINTDATLTSNAFSRPGYRFSGWNTASDGSGASYDDGATVNFDDGGEVTLYAQWEIVTASLVAGQDFNIALKQLAGTEVGDEPVRRDIDASSAWTIYGLNADEVDWRSEVADSNIVEIRFVNELPEGLSLSEATNLAESGSEPVYGFYDDGVVTIYAEAAKIYFNENSWAMFRGLTALTNIVDSSAMIDTSMVENMGNMFLQDGQLADISFLADWDTSNVITMHSIFSMTGIISLADIEKWDASKVESLHGAFAYTNITNADAVLNWDVRNVWDMASVFYLDKELVDISGLRKWQTDSLMDIGWGFGRTKISDLSALSGFKTGKTISIMKTFEFTNVTDLSPIAGWDVSKIENFSYAFSGLQLSSLAPLSGWSVGSAKDMSWMFASRVITEEYPNGDFVAEVVDSPITDVSALSRWSVSNVTDFCWMFAGFSQVESFEVLDDWQASIDADMTKMFEEVPDTTPRPTWYIAWEATQQ